MGKIHSHKDLIVWQKSIELVKATYLATEQFPRDELFGLRSQMQRAAVAIPSNIAEGYLRKHHKEYIQFLSIALGSAAELETQTVICKDLTKFRGIEFDAIHKQLEEVMKMLYVMIRNIEERQTRKALKT